MTDYIHRDDEPLIVSYGFMRELNRLDDEQATTIATLRDALDRLVEAAERVLAYGRVRPFADAARDQLRSALVAAKETP